MQLTKITSFADIGAAAPVVTEKLVNVTEVVVLPVNCKNNVEPLVTSAAKASHPLGAVGSVIVPLEAPPEPTTILNTKVLTAVIVGLVPKPELIVGNVFEVAIKLPPMDKVAGFSVLPLNGGENT